MYQSCPLLLEWDRVNPESDMPLNINRYSVFLCKASNVTSLATSTPVRTDITKLTGASSLAIWDVGILAETWRRPVDTTRRLVKAASYVWVATRGRCTAHRMQMQRAFCSNHSYETQSSGSPFSWRMFEISHTVHIDCGMHALLGKDHRTRDLMWVLKGVGL